MCADCDIPLVPEYETAMAVEVPAAPADPGDPDKDPFCGFWKGDDGRLHAEITSVLDSARIPHKTVRRQDHLFNLTNYPAFQIGVPFSLYERAELAVKEAFDLDASDAEAVQSLTAPRLFDDIHRGIRKLPEMLSPSGDEAIPGPPRAGHGSSWLLEDATVAVWLGDDSWLRDMLTGSLNENGIHCRPEITGKNATIFVLPDDETRAREIVREVCEARPPLED